MGCNWIQNGIKHSILTSLIKLKIFMIKQDGPLVFNDKFSRLELTEKQLTDVNKQLTDAKKQLTDARNQLTEKAFQVDALTASLTDLQEREKR